MNDFLSILLTPIGIGLVIFVHELGHFMAARWAGARVEVFSLGFGAKLVGWRRGDTLFQIAVVPLGGYVKVAGEYYDGTAPKEEGTLSSLSVPQRFLYYSGGVIMNVIFALVVLPLVMFSGMPTESPIIGSPVPGRPAWEAGIPSGSRVLEVNGEEIVDFQHLVTAVAVNGKEPLEVRVESKGEQQTYSLVPKFDETNGVYRIGVPGGFDPAAKLVVFEGSPAEAAGLTAEDRLLSVVGAPPGLPLDGQLGWGFDRGEAMALRVESANGDQRVVTVEPSRDVQGPRRIGVSPTMAVVESVRQSGPASEVVQALGLKPGDEILTVQGQAVYLPRELLEALFTSATPGGPLSIEVQRGPDRTTLIAEIPENVDPIWLATDVSLEVPSDSRKATVLADTPAAAAGLRSGDEIISINGQSVETWDNILESIRAATAKEQAVTILAYRGDPDPATRTREEVEVTVSGEPSVTPQYGFTLAGASFILKAESLGEAVELGALTTTRFMKDVWRQLKKMLLTDEISSKNLGGAISIAAISFHTASEGLAKLFFFLAILSINLAIINLLPIPILDGGHLLFLLVEAVKGSPVSERTFGYSQVVGLVMIMSLMVYVTYQDIMRWIVNT